MLKQEMDGIFEIDEGEIDSDHLEFYYFRCLLFTSTPELLEALFGTVSTAHCSTFDPVRNSTHELLILRHLKFLRTVQFCYYGFTAIELSFEMK